APLPMPTEQGVEVPAHSSRLLNIDATGRHQFLDRSFSSGRKTCDVLHDLGGMRRARGCSISLRDLLPFTQPIGVRSYQAFGLPIKCIGELSGVPLPVLENDVENRSI